MSSETKDLAGMVMDISVLIYTRLLFTLSVSANSVGDTPLTFKLILKASFLEVIPMIEKLYGMGLVGTSKCFKMPIKAQGKGGRLLFVGSPFTCLPFGEFLTYAIRELPYGVYFLPNGLSAMVAEIVKEEGYGYGLAKQRIGNEGNFDVVVFPGGVAMPKSLVDPMELSIRLSSLSDLNFVVGFCFQGVLNKPEWREAFKFRYLIDVEINKVSLLEGDT